MSSCRKRLKEEKRREYWDMEQSNTQTKMAQWHFANKKYDLAIEAYSDAMKRLPDTQKEAQKHMAVLYTKRAECHFRLLDYKSCMSDCNKAIEKGKENCRTWTLKGLCLEANRMYDAATNAYTTSIRMDPDEKDALEGLTRCLKAAFALRNSSQQIKNRIYKNEK